MLGTRIGAVAFVLAAVAGAGCGENSSGSTRADDQGKGSLGRRVAKPGPPGPSLRLRLEAQAAGTDAYRGGTVHVRPGTEVQLRARIRNAGRSETPGAVRAALHLPRGVKPELDTLRERQVGVAEALGRPLTDPEAVFGAGTLLDPFGGGASARLEVTVRVTRGASGALRAGARVSAPGTAARSAVTLSAG